MNDRNIYFSHKKNKTFFVRGHFMTAQDFEFSQNEGFTYNKKLRIINNFHEPISDLVFNESESKNLRFRLQLMLQVLAFIRSEQLTEQEAAKKLKVNLITIEHLMQHKIALLTTDVLLNMLENCGVKIYERLAGVVEAF
jgi:predicted XRE-type DNA-binding protein